MKNIFKFMGIALMAGALMVACNPDPDPEPEPDTTPVNPQPVTPSINVTFGTATWSAGVAQVSTANHAQYSIEEFYIAKEAQSYPFIDMLITSVPGTYTIEAEHGTQYEGTDSSYTYWAWPQSMEVYSFDYYEAQYVSVGQSYYGDWRPYRVVLNMGSFDLNTLTASFTINANMYDFYSWYYMVVNDVEEADTKDLSIVVNNFVFAPMGN